MLTEQGFILIPESQSGFNSSMILLPFFSSDQFTSLSVRVLHYMHLASF
jgi:hypothetical protein